VPSVCCFALGFFLFFVDGIEEKKEKREGKNVARSAKQKPARRGRLQSRMLLAVAL